MLEVSKPSHYTSNENYVQGLNVKMSNHAEITDQSEVQTDLLLENLKDEINLQNQALSIQSSSSVTAMGGVSSNATNFVDVLRRYYQELLPYLLSDEPCIAYKISRPSLGVVSRHRDLERNVSYSSSYRRRDSAFTINSILSVEEAEVAEAFLGGSARGVMTNPSSLNEFMVRMENLGHQVAPFIEGLNIELLPFQKQTVQWAAERERVSGGIKSYNWIKLPFVSQRNTELYYNPALNKFSTAKPSLVRGGIIAGK